MSEIKIVVENGMVTDVYSTIKDVFVTVLDLDVQDPDMHEELEAERGDILRNLHNPWHAVY